METVQSIMDKVINNLQKIHVAGVTEQRLMINAIEVLEKIKSLISVDIIQNDSENGKNQKEE